MNAPIKRVEGKSFGKPTHWYVRTDTNEKIPGVTDLLKRGKPSPALVGWGIKSVSEFAINNWDDLTAMPIAERLNVLKRSPYAERDAAASRGTLVHHLAEKLANGEEVDVPDDVTGHVESAIRFLDEWQPEVILSEVTVYNLDYGYAGTLDLIARFPDGRVALCDYKTSKGVYADTALQLAAYRFATHYLDADGEAQPMPEVDWCGVVHIRADGYDVYELRCDEHVLRQFRYVAAVARAMSQMDEWKSEPLNAPRAEVA